MSLAVTPSSSEQRFRIELVNWEKDEQMAAWFEERRVRLTCDRGERELRTVSHRHEYHKHLLAVLLRVLIEELDIDVAVA
jgi:hypothetical protein